MTKPERTIWLRFLPPNKVTEVIRLVDELQKIELLDLLDEPTRIEVNALLTYLGNTAGGSMNPRFARIRPEITVDEAISYLRNEMRSNIQSIASLNTVYVLNKEQQLMGIISFRDLFSAPGNVQIQTIMRKKFPSVKETYDLKTVSQLCALHNMAIIPVLDDNHRMRGIVTTDAIMDIFQDEATKEIHNIGGVEVLDEPYMTTEFKSMFAKRARWLSLLFIGELFTSTAMALFENEIATAVVLALFVPLIISSGGNSGSQASTLIIRAMSLKEITLKQWFDVMKKELMMGIGLGALLGCIGFLRITLWQFLFKFYGVHFLILAFTIFCSLEGVVLWGTLVGSMLPFILRKLGVDPAMSSAPLVATVVDVSGLIIYFTTAKLLLTGTLL